MPGHRGYNDKKKKTTFLEKVVVLLFQSFSLSKIPSREITEKSTFTQLMTT